MAGAEVAESRTVRLAAPDGPVQVRTWPQAQGQGTSTTLLAFHGWTDSGEVFAPLASALGRRWTVVAPDAPAHGGTPLRDGPFVIADHAIPALAVLDSIRRSQLAGPGHRATVVYGHSMGALTAARVAAARPSLVSGLVLEDPARTTPRRGGSSRAMRAWVEGLRSGDHASRVAWVRANHPDWAENELGPWAHSKETLDLEHLDRDADWGEPLPALLSEVRCPVLIVRGEPTRGGIVSRPGPAAVPPPARAEPRSSPWTPVTHLAGRPRPRSSPPWSRSSPPGETHP